MLVTVGTGKERIDIASAINFSLRHQNPDYIVFVVTAKSNEETLPLIIKNLDVQHLFEILPDENDIEDIQQRCQSYLKNLIQKGYSEGDIVVDFTSGTKAMSSGLVLAAITLKVGMLSYIAGKRDGEGRVMSGTERLISLTPNRIYADYQWKEIVSLFNTVQFDSCLKLIPQARSLLAELEFQEKLGVMENLAKAYSLWEKFDFDGALSLLEEAVKSELVEKWGIKRRIEYNKNILYKEKNDAFCLERAVDLLENAKRRGNLEGKYDDAMARLYRLVEFLAQSQIAKKGLYRKKSNNQQDTENLNVEQLPTELKNKYSTEKYRDRKDGKVKLGLYEDFELLADLDDELGKRFVEEFKQKDSQMKKLLALRNNSILAHGFNPIAEKGYREMFVKMEELIKLICVDMGDIEKKIIFPQIKIP